jgi:phosphate transport system protein
MTALDQDLQEITSSVVRMLSLVRESSGLAKQALVDADVEAADAAMGNDVEVDELQDELEQRILTVIARRQPAARDLRFLGAMYRSISDIERAGDYAKHTARAAKELAAESPLKKYLDMERILEVVSEMIEQTIAGLTDADVDVARHALAMDNEIDDLYEQIQRELLTYMIEDPATISKATRLLSTARFLERLGDHIENVNEHVIFWLTGDRI